MFLVGIADQTATFPCTVTGWLSQLRQTVYCATRTVSLHAVQVILSL